MTTDKPHGLALSFQPYKEPLRPVEKGFGYLGTLGRTADGAFVQCHICGLLVGHLGSHANKKHSVTAEQYRKQFQLARRTPLVSTTIRERYVAAAIAAPPEVKVLRLENLQKSRDDGLAKHPSWSKSLETRNREGSCPD